MDKVFRNANQQIVMVELTTEKLLRLSLVANFSLELQIIGNWRRDQGRGVLGAGESDDEGHCLMVT